MSTCDNCIEETDAIVCEECQEEAWQSAEEVGRSDERKLIAAWLRTTPRARGVLVSIASSQDIARLADGIERGDHQATPKRGTST